MNKNKIPCKAWESSWDPDRDIASLTFFFRYNPKYTQTATNSTTATVPMAMPAIAPPAIPAYMKVWCKFKKHEVLL